MVKLGDTRSVAVIALIVAAVAGVASLANVLHHPDPTVVTRTVQAPPQTVIVTLPAEPGQPPETVVVERRVGKAPRIVTSSSSTSKASTSTSSSTTTTTPPACGTLTVPMVGCPSPPTTP